jgi:hypothetical protein
MTARVESIGYGTGTVRIKYTLESTGAIDSNSQGERMKTTTPEERNLNAAYIVKAIRVCEVMTLHGNVKLHDQT